MIPFNISDEQPINTSAMMVGGMGRSAFRMSRWIARQRRAKRLENTGLLKDALSVYRGGEAVKGDSQHLHELIRDLTGTTDLSAGKDFIFLGDRSDFSFFWRREKGKNIILDKQMIEQIPDAELKERVKSVMAMGVLDGSLLESKAGFTLSQKGEKLIYQMDFIMRRLKKNLNVSETVLETFEAEKSVMKSDRIDAALKALGIDPAIYDGCNRATLNTGTLLIKEMEDQTLFFVPTTGRSMQVLIPNDNLVRLDERTFAAFIRPDEKFFIKNRNGAAEQISGKDLFSYFDSKNKTKEIKDLEQMKVAMNGPEEELATAADPSRQGEEWIVSDETGNEFLFSVKNEISLPDGTEALVLQGGKGQADIILPKSAIGDVALPARESTSIPPLDPERIKAFWAKNEGLRSQLPKTEELIFRPGNYKEFSDSFSVQAGRNSSFEKITFSKAEGTVLQDGSLAVNLKDGAKIKSGAYSQTLTKSGADAIMKAYGAGQSASAASAAAAAVKTMPVIDPATAAAKTVMQVAAKTFQTAQTAQQAGQALSQKL